MLKKVRLILAVLLPVLLINACKDDETDIGLNVLPEKDIVKPMLSDTFSLETYTYTVDSLPASSGSRLTVGRSEDPVFGTTKAGIALQFALQNSFTYPDSIVVDAVTLQLYYSEEDSVYGYPYTPFDIEVYRLNKRLYADSTYYSNIEPESIYSNSDFLGSNTIFPFQEEFENKISIPLDTNLIADFGAADSRYFTLSETDFDFKDFFNGVYLKSSDDNETLLNLKIDSGAYIKIDYHYPVDEFNKYDEIITANNSNCVRLNLFEHDYSQTDFAEHLNSEEHQAPYSYLQTMSGLKTVLNLPHLQDYDILKDKTIYRAEIVFPAAEQAISHSDTYPPAKTVLLVGEDENGDYIYLEEYRTETGSYSGENYNEDEQSYSFDITHFLQSVLDGEQENIELSIMTAGGSSGFRRSVLNSPSHPDKPAKLVITYSEQ